MSERWWDCPNGSCTSTREPLKSSTAARALLSSFTLRDQRHIRWSKTSLGWSTPESSTSRRFTFQVTSIRSARRLWATERAACAIPTTGKVRKINFQLESSKLIFVPLSEKKSFRERTFSSAGSENPKYLLILAVTLLKMLIRWDYSHTLRLLRQ